MPSQIPSSVTTQVGGSVKFFEASVNGENYLELKAPDDLEYSVSFQMPGVDGDANSILQTDGSGNLFFSSDVYAGIVTSTSGFSGNLTGDVNAGFVTASSGFVGNLTGDVNAGFVTASSGFVGNLTGDVTGNLTGNITGVAATFTGDVSIGGTLTYEDVTNIDSIGIITARTGIRVLDGGINVVGVITATNGFSGNLTGDVTGNLTGDVTGNVTGDVNAGFVTATSGFVGNLTGDVTG